MRRDEVRKKRKPRRPPVAAPKAVAERTLKSAATGDPVHVVLYAPEPNSEHDDEWACRVEIRWNGEIKSLTGRGGDSLQSLFTALDALRGRLKMRANELTYMEVRGWLGMPLMIQDDNPDFLALVEHLIGVEHCRRAISFKDQRRKKR